MNFFFWGGGEREREGAQYRYLAAREFRIFRVVVKMN